MSATTKRCSRAASCEFSQRSMASWFFMVWSVVGDWVVDVSDSGQVTCGCNSVSKSQAKINRRHVDNPLFWFEKNCSDFPMAVAARRNASLDLCARDQWSRAHADPALASELWCVIQWYAALRTQRVWHPLSFRKRDLQTEALGSVVRARRLWTGADL